MSPKKSHGFSKSKAIQNALGRLGYHAKPRDVVAALAELGVHVSEGLVRKVRLQLLKAADRTRRQQAKARQAARPRAVSRPQKRPETRGPRR